MTVQSNWDPFTATDEEIQEFERWQRHEARDEQAADQFAKLVQVGGACESCGQTAERVLDGHCRQCWEEIEAGIPDHPWPPEGEELEQFEAWLEQEWAGR